MINKPSVFWELVDRVLTAVMLAYAGLCGTADGMDIYFAIPFVNVVGKLTIDEAFSPPDSTRLKAIKASLEKQSVASTI